MKKNVSSQTVGVQMVSATDGSAFTGTVTVYVTVDGGTQAIGSTGSGVCTHEGNGFHSYVPTSGETDGGHIAFTFIGTGAVPATVQVYTSWPQTGDSFDRIGVAGAGLTAIDLPDQAMNITGNITGNLSGSVGSVTGNVGGNVTGSVGSVTGNVGGNVAGSVASVTAAVTLPTIPTNWITAAGINSAAITSAKIASGAITSTQIAANAIGASQIASDAITAAKIAADAIGASELAADAATEIATAVWAAAVRTLTAGTNLNNLSQADIRTAIGIAAANLDTQISLLATAANLATVAGYVDTEIATLQTTLDGMAGATFDTSTDSLEAIRNRGDAAWITGGGGSAPTVEEIRIEMDDNSTKLSAILGDTNELQSDDIPGLIAALNDFDPTSDTVDVGKINGSAEAASDLAKSAATIVSGAAATGTLSTTQMTTDLSEATDDHYNGRIIIWTSGVLKDQATNITDYVGAGGLLTFTATTEAPSNGDTFVIV